MKKIFFLISLIFIIKLGNLCYSQNYQWAISIGNLEWDVSNSMTVDSSGYVYVIGGFQDTVDFDNGIGVANLIAIGYSDIFFAKYDNNGNYIWAKQIGSTDYNSGECITIDNSNNVFITGYYSGITDFDP
jgi:hypothetical protein